MKTLMTEDVSTLVDYIRKSFSTKCWWRNFAYAIEIKFYNNTNYYLSGISYVRTLDLNASCHVDSISHSFLHCISDTLHALSLTHY